MLIYHAICKNKMYLKWHYNTDLYHRKHIFVHAEVLIEKTSPCSLSSLAITRHGYIVLDINWFNRDT